MRSAVASAALAGSAYEIPDVRAGVVLDPVVHGALRVSQALDGMATRWTRSPSQVLVKLHVLAATGSVPSERLGLPRAGKDVGIRLTRLADALVNVPAGTPGLLVAAVVHGELLVLAPFDGPSSVVARGAARLTLIALGVDPRGLLAIDAAHLQRQPEYIGSSGAFATGTADGLRSWFRHYATAVQIAAVGLGETADEIAAA